MRQAGTTLALLAAFGGFSCGQAPHPPVVAEATAMNTFVTISVYDAELPRSQIDWATQAAIAEIRRIEAFASDYDDSSEIGRANRAAGRDSIRISDELARLIAVSTAYGDATGGAFDITVEPLERLWDFLAQRPRVPSPDSVRRARRLVDYRKIRLTRGWLGLPEKGMGIDLGAIGKGYAADHAAAVLRKRGIRRAIVDLGGNLALIWPGTRGLDSSVATISVRHPRIDGAFFGSFRCGEGGISTSGDYQRCFIVDGIRYHHILNPAGGYPARGVVSVTVVAPNATDADALSTILFVLGRERGMSFLHRIPGAEAVFVFEQGDTLAMEMSSGFQGKFTRSR